MSKRSKPRPRKSKRNVPAWLRERTRIAAVLVALVFVLTTAAVFANRWDTWGRVDNYAEGAVLTDYQMLVVETQAYILTVGGVFLLAALCWLLANVWGVLRRSPMGLCPDCGYTGNTSGRCPGCGRELRGHPWYARSRLRPRKNKRSIPTWLRERTRLSATLVALTVALTTAVALANRWATWERVGSQTDGNLRRAYEMRGAETEVGILTVGSVLFLAALCWLLVNVRAVLRRLPKGFCPDCGYDLTGNTSGRCPECGRELRGHLRYSAGSAEIARPSQTAGRA